MNLETRSLVRDLSAPTAKAWRGGSWHGETPTGKVVANWHDEHHVGSFGTCQDSLCVAVRLVD